MSRKRLLSTILAVVVLLNAGCVGIGLPSTAPPADRTPAAQTGDGSRPAGVGSDSLTSTPRYATLYDRTIDSVVQIRVRTPRGQSQGSGFVYDAEGHIVTNQHVVGQADRVQVRFQTGQWRVADVVGTDVYTDLAVLKVESLPTGVDPLPVTRRDPEPGQPVVALGSPFGFEGTITHGIISGLNRSMPTDRGFAIPDTIQTDAPINPGNSGGPLVSLNGTVVGVNRAKQGDNLGFAISADIVRMVVPKLIETGSFHHSFMGIRTVPVTPVVARANDLDSTRGVMVVEILEGGPSAGVLEPARLARTDSGVTVPVDGDVIVSIDGTRIRSQQALARYLMLHTNPGDDVTVTVLRDGRRVAETVTLGSRPELSTTGPV